MLISRQSFGCGVVDQLNEELTRSYSKIYFQNPLKREGRGLQIPIIPGYIVEKNLPPGLVLGISRNTENAMGGQVV